jgi:UDP-2,4-diacetamido-2,4,6-trideoxy-beta-L-altropyranose hydrolase
MRVVFRTDASRVIGSGHVMRSLTLAEALRDAGAEVAFVARRHESNLNNLLRMRGFAVAELPEPQVRCATQADPVHAAWVGADWEDDARETRLAIRALGARPDWLVVDHYGLDERWEADLRPEVARIFAVDDLADRRHDCDLLLDQNLVEGFATRYLGKLPDRSAAMLGPRYALLQPGYAELHPQVAPRTGAVRRVFIYFGSVDPHGLTQLALRAFLDLSTNGIEVDVVIDDVAADPAGLRACAAGHANVHLHTRLPSLAPLLARADLAIGAAGATSWERLCLGVPALVITVADNQRPVAAALERRGLIRWLGHHDEVGLGGLRDALARYLAHGADTASSRAGRATVDGVGVRRVRTALLVDPDTPLVVRAAAASDEDLLLEWANDPLTRRNSFGRAIIGAEEHHEWLRDRLHARHSCLLLVIETQDGMPLGTARFDRIETGWKLNYSVGAQYRGRGLGLRVLECALATLARSHPGASWVVARVMAANDPSHRLFRRLGFEAVTSAAGAVEYRRAL